MEQDRHREREEIWIRHIEQWRTSGKSRRQYCLDETISYWTFREWQKRLKEGKSTGTLVPIPRESYQSPVPTTSGIELVIHRSIVIRLDVGFHQETLRTVLRELGVRS